MAVALTVYGHGGGVAGRELQRDGGHAGGGRAGAAEGQGDGTHGPAGGVRPLQARGQDGQAAFSQDGGEEGEAGEGGPPAVRWLGRRGGLRAGGGGGGQALAGGEAGGVNEAGAGLQEVPPDPHHGGGEDPREDGGAGGDGAAEGGSPHGGPPPVSPVPALRQDGVPGRGQRRPQVGAVGRAAPLFPRRPTPANLGEPGAPVSVAGRVCGSAPPRRGAAERAR